MSNTAISTQVHINVPSPPQRVTPRSPLRAILSGPSAPWSRASAATHAEESHNTAWSSTHFGDEEQHSGKQQSFQSEN